MQPLYPAGPKPSKWADTLSKGLKRSQPIILETALQRAVTAGRWALWGYLIGDKRCQNCVVDLTVFIETQAATGISCHRGQGLGRKHLAALIYFLSRISLRY